MGEDPNKNSQKNIAVGVCQTFLTTAGRPGRSTVNGHISDRWGKSVGRRVDRNKPRALTRAQSTERSADVHTCTLVHVGRPASVRSDKTDLQKQGKGFLGLDLFGFRI